MFSLLAEEKAELRKIAQWCRIQCIPLQQQLETTQQEAIKAARLLQYTEALEKEETDKSEARQRWYDNQRYTAESRLEKWGRYVQLQLEVKIALLQKEAELYEAHFAAE